MSCIKGKILQNSQAKQVFAVILALKVISLFTGKPTGSVFHASLTHSKDHDTKKLMLSHNPTGRFRDVAAMWNDPSAMTTS